MKQDGIRQALIDGTIHVIAQDGLDGATTKRIGMETGINQAYIYRYFADKEDMFVKTFATLDGELIDKITACLPVMDVKEIPIEERCWLLFAGVWKFLLGNSEKCMCYIRYYYSPYFKKHSMKDRSYTYRFVVQKMTPAFVPGAEVWHLLNHILNIMFTSAVRVFNGELSDDDKTAEHVFRLIYSSVASQLTWSKNIS